MDVGSAHIGVITGCGESKKAKKARLESHDIDAPDRTLSLRAAFSSTRGGKGRRFDWDLFRGF